MASERLLDATLQERAPVVDVIDGNGAFPVRRREGRDWRIGTDADVEWIRGSTTVGLTIRSAIPPVFEAYATVVVPDEPPEGVSRDARLVLQLLAEQSGDQPWWLGYLETSASDDVVFPDAPRITLYAGWDYVLVQAGPAEAARWRIDQEWWRPGPDLVFPADRSWLMSRLWDDDWRRLGGSTALIERFEGQPHLDVRRVGVDEDATPPGHVAR